MIDNRPVGLWMLPAHVSASRSALAALQREFARLRTLDHPHIARLHELGCNGQQYYVTGERLDGESLRDVLTHLLPERLEIGEADDIVRAIGAALVYAHEHCVVHGDVRAENVLVTMDRRFMLTNFLARRLTKLAARPPRPSDDLAGLARLAAELYTGSASPHVLRAAAHGGVPAARLNAIRGVLETPANRRSGSVADFLAAAGLAFPGGASVRRTGQPRSRLLWRLVLPVATVVGVGMLVATYTAGGDWQESAAELQQRGLDALKTVATRVTPPAPEPSKTQPLPASPPAGAPGTGSAQAGAVERAAASGEPANAAAAPAVAPELAVEPAPVEPAPDQQPAGAPSATPAAQTPPPPTTATVRRGDPPVLSLGLPRIAAREDHAVVAIDVVRSGDTTREVAVGWWTTADTAHEDEDYAPGTRKTLTIPAGATHERLLIPIVNDSLRESDEVFTVHLSRPRNAVTGAVSATRVTLHDDD